jgi:hypothetical protein
VTFELEPKVVVDDGDQSHLAALAMHGQVAAVVVAELETGKLTLA